MTWPSIQRARLIKFSEHHGDGVLTVYPVEENGVPFEILRVYTLTGVPAHATKANHAHRDCSKLSACLFGKVNILVKDGEEEKEFTLCANGTGLLIPPMLWVSVSFETPSTVLAMFCDRPYESSDYIHTWSEYMKIRQANTI